MWCDCFSGCQAAAAGCQSNMRLSVWHGILFWGSVRVFFEGSGLCPRWPSQEMLGTGVFSLGRVCLQMSTSMLIQVYTIGCIAASVCKASLETTTGGCIAASVRNASLKTATSGCIAAFVRNSPVKTSTCGCKAASVCNASLKTCLASLRTCLRRPLDMASIDPCGCLAAHH